MPKVLIADSLSPRALEIFRARGIDVEVKTGLKPEELKEMLGQYDGLAVRSATRVSAELIAAAKNLKVIGRAGIGVDTIDVAAATQAGIVVMNTPFGNSITTAEHAIALMFALARQIPQADRSTQAGKWEKAKFMGVEVTGKVLGIIGCGTIGSIVAERALGLRMKVVAFDPFLSVERAKALGVDKLALDDLLARSDFITLHTPLTNETRDLLNAEAFAKMKEGVRIVNCARGGLIVESDLKAALESGRVAAAALDVFLVEPARENPLFGLDSLIATPHLGASTAEAQEKVALQIAEQISDFLLEGAVVNAVNLPSISADEAPRLAPYKRLAGQLGALAGQLLTSGVTGITLELHGEASAIPIRPVTTAALVGLLKPVLETVNPVSAPLAARERNIQMVEVTRDTATDYHTLVSLTVTTDDGALTIEGTLVGSSLPRIVKLGAVPLEAGLGKHMLFIRNQDKPGFIGALGGILGAAGVNIATLHLGRISAGADAVLLTEVDQPIPAALLEKLRRLPQVVEARALHF